MEARAEFLRHASRVTLACLEQPRAIAAAAMHFFSHCFAPKRAGRRRGFIHTFTR
jgi:hypothetical protein